MEKKEQRETARAIVAKIKHQCGKSAEEELMFAVFRMVVSDVMADPKRPYQQSAERYMNGDMPHLSAMGIDPDWVRGLFRTAGIGEVFDNDPVFSAQAKYCT